MPFSRAPGAWLNGAVGNAYQISSGKMTRLTLRQSGIPAGEMMEMTEAGWKTSLDRLERSLK
jgi:Activator of Hsp90 ATPase homolog 1-like protein